MTCHRRSASTAPAVVPYDAEADARAAQDTLVRVGVELTAGLMQGAIQRSVGTVVISDGVFDGAATRWDAGVRAPWSTPSIRPLKRVRPFH